jgi:sulfur carrier protein
VSDAAVRSAHGLRPARDVQLTVNGRPSEVADGTTLLALLEQLGLRPGSVVVEHNGTALLRSELAAARLGDGDRLELVRAVAGG